MPRGFPALPEVSRTRAASRRRGPAPAPPGPPAPSGPLAAARCLGIQACSPGSEEQRSSESPPSGSTRRSRRQKPGRKVFTRSPISPRDSPASTSSGTKPRFQSVAIATRYDGMLRQERRTSWPLSGRAAGLSEIVPTRTRRRSAPRRERSNVSASSGGGRGREKPDPPLRGAGGAPRQLSAKHPGGGPPQPGVFAGGRGENPPPPGGGA